MQLINKIDIEYYRSLKKVTIKEINDLNVFSGKNDIGKSNILNALDTFFNKKELNFNDDYNKERLEEVRQESIKGKQFIKITLELINPGGYKTLPERFNISRSWDRNGRLIEGLKDNFESLNNAKKFGNLKIDIARRSLSKLLNKIRFTYVPAIRDEKFFSYLLNKLQETIFEAEERKKNQTFQSNLKDFNATISELTTALNNEFETVSGISSSLSFPNSIAEIFQSLIIDTKSGDHEIPLRLRGDGVRLRYIPTILNYISENSRYYEIWGFDEPENSCEYSLTKKIAEQFVEDYSEKNQIFVASHSFHFISIDASNTSKYRVFRMDNAQSTSIAKIDDSNKNLLSNELGVLAINQELLKLYETLNAEMDNIAEIKDALQNTQKPYLIFEGQSDNILFEAAYKRLYGKDIQLDFTLCEHMTADGGSAIGSSARFINEFLYNHISKIPTNNKVIGIFDCDTTGINEIKPLKRTFNQIDTTSDKYFAFQHKTKKNIFAITLVAPHHRFDFFNKINSKYCYISTELLLFDQNINQSNKDYPSLYDRRVFSFCGNKVGFANNIASAKDTINFQGFEDTFNLIKKILRVN